MKKGPMVWALLLLMFWGCGTGGKGKKGTAQTAETLAETTRQHPQALPPLQAGEVHMEEDVFGPVIELRGRNLPVNLYFKFQDPELIIRDELLVVENPIHNDHFMAFHLPDFKLERIFGRDGQGPGEFVHPQIMTTEAPGKIAVIYETMRNRFYAMDRNLSFTELPFRPDIGKRVIGFYHFLRDNEVVYCNINKDHKGMGIYHEGDKVEQRQIYDLSFSPKHQHWVYYIGAFAANQRQQRIVHAYSYFKRLVFMDLDGRSVKTVVFKSNEVHLAAPGWVSEGIDHVGHYRKVYAGNNYLYFLYWGRKLPQMQAEEKISSGYVWVEQWDWNGNPIRKFKLDQSGFIAVDEGNNKLYLMSRVEDEPFFVFDLPPLKALLR